MKYRQIPLAGFKVSEIGFDLGTFCRKELLIREDDALRWIRAAFDLGITLFDASEKEGEGYGETLLPKALPKQRDEWIISTKIGYDIYSEPSFLRPVKKIEQNFSPANLVLSVDHALRRLKTDRIDIVQLHHIGLREVERDEIWDTLGALVKAGKILSSGVVLKSGDEMLRTGLDAIAYRKPAVVQHDYNLLAPDPGRMLHSSAILGKGFGDRDELFEHNPTMGSTPSSSPVSETRFLISDALAGILGDTAPNSLEGNSVEELRTQLRKRQDLAFLTGPETGRTLPQAAILWLLAHPTTGSVLPPIDSLAQLKEFAATPEKTPLTPNELEEVLDRQKSWKSNHPASS